MKWTLGENTTCLNDSISLPRTFDIKPLLARYWPSRQQKGDEKIFLVERKWLPLRDEL